MINEYYFKIVDEGGAPTDDKNKVVPIIITDLIIPKVTCTYNGGEI